MIDPTQSPLGGAFAAAEQAIALSPSLKTTVLPALQSSGSQVAFVDSSLDNIDDLIASLGEASVYLIDAEQDGAIAISSVLFQLKNDGNAIDSVHIFAHGQSGELQLGSAILTADSLTGYGDRIDNWGDSQTGDVLLYGCNVAEGDIGQSFIQQLAMITGADIQASTDLTGSAQLGGDWDLEAAIGSIEAGLAISEAGQTSYVGTLAKPRITSNGGRARASVVIAEGTDFVTDVSVVGANGYSEGFGIEYYFQGGRDSYLFNIDVNSGVVSFKNTPDFDNPTDVGRNNVYDINILAIDWTGQSDTQKMAVTVEQAASQFGITNNPNISVDEGTSVVTDLSVTGAANGFNESYGVEYYFNGGQDSYLFNLNNNTGVLSFKTAPSFDTPIDSNRDNVYDVGILAIDYSGLSDRRSLAVTVQDIAVAGSAPVITSNGGNPYAAVEIAEGNKIVTDFSVTDSDGQAEGNGITYSFKGGIDQRFFRINRNTGVLSFKNAPDFESPADANGDNIYGVDVLVTDATGQTDSQFIDVRVIDTAEVSAPVINSNGGGDTATITLDEGTTVVTDVTTTSSNGFSEGNGLTYSINAGDDAGLFEINRNTGLLAFKMPPDYENPADADGNNVYFANVLVQDPDGQADSQFISVVVRNIAESGSAPVITSNGGNNSAFVRVQENNTFAVDMQISDADGDTEGNGISYTINDGEDRGLFDIDQNTGVISFKVAPDFETALDSDRNNIYRINVLATDSTGKSDSQFIQVEVTNLVSVYLLGGQSNMAGDTSDVAFLNGKPQGNPLPAVQFWNRGSNSYEALVPGFNGNFGGADGFGAEIGFGHKLAAAYASGSVDGEEIYLIKYAIGATSLDVDWNVNGSGNQYDNFTQWVGDALTVLTNAGIGYDVEGMLWMQGENDSISATSAANYQSNLTNLIGDVRSRYGSDLDFVIGRLHEELPSGFYTDTDTVRAAQVAVASSDSRNYWFDTDGLPVNTDSVHFTSAGHLALGEKFADVFIS